MLEVETGADGNGLLLPGRDFTAADQRAFAAVSGDTNPIHIDECYARRTQAGRCVVHGVHIVLWALDVLVANGHRLDRLVSLKAEFGRFSYVGAYLLLRVTQSARDRMRVEALQDGQVTTTLTLKFGEAASTPAVDANSAAPGFATISIGSEPRILDEHAQTAFSGHVSPASAAPGANVEHLFPSACVALGGGRVSDIAVLSAVVGMVCPGLHSIFSSFTLALQDDDGRAPGVTIESTKVDNRFRLVMMRLCARRFRGEIVAFERQPPINVDLQSACALVATGEFADISAVIIGGSRGLGAASAKLIAAGGGRVVLTYVRGIAEARDVSDELSAAFGPEVCDLLRYNVLEDPPAEVAAALQTATHLLYFATPQIFGKQATYFDPLLFQRFNEIYILAFDRLLKNTVRTFPLRILYPSSEAVATRPIGLSEYAMSKAAGEIYCQETALTNAMFDIHVPRLPRILTDQTATVLPVKACDALAAMLPLLRAGWQANAAA